MIHLAAQAGVHYFLKAPFAYADSNLTGFLSVLEGCYYGKIPHFIYASSSSVYGTNNQFPCSTNMSVDNPIFLYAATKRDNELMAHVYSHLYNFPTTGLRFFTVYGPWHCGRPDMALFKFTKAILEMKPIDVYNNGDLSRDFTFVEDIVEGILSIVDIILPKKSDKSLTDSSDAPYRIYNIGNGQTIK